MDIIDIKATKDENRFVVTTSWSLTSHFYTLLVFIFKEF